MNAHSYDTIRFEAQQHFNRLADEAAAERLARRLGSATAPKRVEGVRWLRRHRGFVARLVHPVRTPVAARPA